MNFDMLVYRRIIFERSLVIFLLGGVGLFTVMGTICVGGVHHSARNDWDFLCLTSLTLR